MTLENTLKMLDQALPYVVVIAAISLSIFLLATAIYSFPYYQKKINLKKSKDIIEENRQVVEDATFFAANKKYQAIIDEQLEQIRTNASKNKSLLAQIDDAEVKVKRSKKK